MDDAGWRSDLAWVLLGVVETMVFTLLRGVAEVGRRRRLRFMRMMYPRLIQPIRMRWNRRVIMVTCAEVLVVFREWSRKYLGMHELGEER